MRAPDADTRVANAARAEGRALQKLQLVEWPDGLSFRHGIAHSSEDAGRDTHALVRPSPRVDRCNGRTGHVESIRCRRPPHPWRAHGLGAACRAPAATWRRRSVSAVRPRGDVRSVEGTFAR